MKDKPMKPSERIEILRERGADAEYQMAIVRYLDQEWEKDQSPCIICKRGQEAGGDPGIHECSYYRAKNWQL